MRFTVLGSGTAAPDPERGPAGFIARTPMGAVLLDGGSGTLGRCAAAGTDPRELAAVVYSHRHPDHTADLVPLLFALRATARARSQPLRIYAARGFAAHLAGLRAVYGHWIEPPCGVELIELPADSRGSAQLLPDLRLRTAPAPHSAGALHLALTSPEARVAFSGDTAPSPELTRLASGVDLLVCECALPEPEAGVEHMDPESVARLAAAACPGELWLTHLYPRTDPIRALAIVASAGVPVRHARDLDEWQPDPGSD